MYIIGAVLVIGAIWLVISLNDKEEVTTETRTFSGTVTNVNLDEMAADGPARITFTATTGTEHEIAIPSMNLPLCAAKDAITSPNNVAAGDTIEVQGSIDENGVIVPCEDASDYFRVEGILRDESVELMFPYRKGPNGYVVQNGPTGMSVDPEFIKGYMLTLESDYVVHDNFSLPREGAPTIQVRVYNNPANSDAPVWAQNHPLESNIELAFGEPEEAVVGGANAVKYTADGLYASENYIVATGGYIYVFTGAYIDDSSPQRVDFGNIIRAVTFIPEDSTVEPPIAS